MRDSRGLELSGHDSSRIEDIYIRFYTGVFGLLVHTDSAILFYKSVRQDPQISPEEVEERKEVCYQSLWQKFLESL